ncbi:MAG TPA: hypothetical protein DCM68_03505 [Verrucomicrobia bacterium]|nr:hypothetical protein [Verrucomicrobiota bacterium]
MGKSVYASLIFLFVVLGFVLQFNWMQGVKEKKAEEFAPQGLADKISRWMLQKRGLDPDMLSEGQPGVDKINCAICMGTGRVLGQPGEKAICPICQGVGFRMIRRFDAADRICPFCSGMGRVELPDTGVVGTCPRCDGRGLVRSRATAESVPDGI